MLSKTGVYPSASTQDSGYDHYRCCGQGCRRATLQDGMPNPQTAQSRQLARQHEPLTIPVRPMQCISTRPRAAAAAAAAANGKDHATRAAATTAASSTAVDEQHGQGKRRGCVSRAVDAAGAAGKALSDRRGSRDRSSQGPDRPGPRRGHGAHPGLAHPRPDTQLRGRRAACLPRPKRLPSPVLQPDADRADDAPAPRGGRSSDSDREMGERERANMRSPTRTGA